MEKIPIVDISAIGLNNLQVTREDLEKVGQKIVKAFESIGFVYLKNVGIPSSLIDDLNEKSGRFFDKEMKAKNRYKFAVETAVGYSCVELEGFDLNKPGDYKETYDIRSVYGPNVKWPDDLVPGFSDVVIEFCEKSKLLGMRVLEALSYVLGMTGSRFLPKLHSKILTDENLSSVRCLRYPAINGELKEGQVRLGEHTDYGTISLLFQDSVGGLQLKTPDGRYMEARPIPDTVLVNVGDVLQYWTKGRLRSTPHRILAPQSQKQRQSCRRSAAYFLHPDRDVVISDNVMDDDVVNNNVETNLKVKSSDLKGMTAGEYAKKLYNITYMKKR